MEIVFKALALKKLRSINPADRKKALKKIEALGKNHLLGKPLKGKLTGLRSLRAWPLRIIYQADLKKGVITVELIDYRGNVYV